MTKSKAQEEAEAKKAAAVEDKKRQELEQNADEQAQAARDDLSQINEDFNALWVKVHAAGDDFQRSAQVLTEAQLLFQQAREG